MRLERISTAIAVQRPGPGLERNTFFFPVRKVLAPYLLGGPGWYKRSVSPIEGPADELDVSTTEFGWHAGGGVEVRAGRHFGIHADYRYTFLDFNDDDDEEIPGGGFVGRLLPGYKGSMWTVGATVYF